MDGPRDQINKALTTDDIRAQAQNWNLAGDVGLLLHLEQFSENILSKAQGTQKALDDLFNSCEETNVEVSNVTNQFLALQNSQFVENRVYDDETPTEEKKVESKVVNQEEQDRLMLSRYKEAVEVGVKLLDTHFEQVQLPPSSDSDDEDVSLGSSSLVWRSKNPYADKPFPLLIGSAEWWADDNVGLGEYEENIDSEKVLSESDSELEADRNVEKRVRMSSTSSSDSESNANKNSVVPNSIIDDNMFLPPKEGIFDEDSNLFGKDDGNLFGENIFGPQSPLASERLSPTFPKPNKVLQDANSDRSREEIFPQKQAENSIFSDEEEDDFTATESSTSRHVPSSLKPNKFQNAFSKELAAKLGSVANKQGQDVKNENSDPLSSDFKSREQSALFDDKQEDDFLKSSNISSMFKKPNLFCDDAESEKLFGGSNSLFSGSSDKGLFSNDYSVSPKRLTTETSQVVPESSSSKNVPQSGGLFEGGLFADVDDEDTLFSSKPLTDRLRAAVVGSESHPTVKVSTPNEAQHNLNLNLNVTDADELFGSISGIANNSESFANATDSSWNDAHLFDGELNKDLGFVEPSVDDLSRNKSSKSSNVSFQPQFSSTQRTSRQETSDYKTCRVSSECDTNVKSDSSNSAAPLDNEPNKMFQSKKIESSASTEKSQNLFQDDDDDLFTASSSTASKPSKVKESLFNDLAEGDDLFASLKTKSAKQTFVGKKHDSELFPKSDGGLFDEEDNVLFSDTTKSKDTVSISSSRSSLFDDISVGKSTLQSVFEKDKSLKPVDDLFGSADNGCFEKKVTQSDLEDKNNVFKDNKPKESSKNTKSLFGNVDDSDDLFGFTKKQNLFSDGVDDDDLFGKSSTTQKIVTEKKNVSVAKDTKLPASVKPAKLFAADNSLDDTDDLFGSSTSKVNASLKVVKEEKTTSSVEKIKIKDEKDSAAVKVHETTSVLESTSREPKHLQSKLFEVKSSGNLFDDDDKDSDDLFSASGKTVNLSKSSKSDVNKVPTEPAEKKITAQEIADVLDNNPLMPKPNVKENFPVKTDNNSMFKKVEKVKPEVAAPVTKKEPLGLFNDDLGDALFSEGGNKPPPVAKRKVAKDDPLFPTKATPPGKSEQPVAHTKEREKPPPPKSLNIKKTVDLPKPEEKSEVDGGVISAVKSKKVGKLNIPSNLNINPTALLPGAKIKKDVIEKAADSKVLAPVNLDEPAGAPNLLPCRNKDRVKIQAPRRPQSRQARREALRSSGIDFGVENEAGHIVSKSKSEENIEGYLSSPNSTFPVPSRMDHLKKQVVSNVEDALLVKNLEESPAVHDNTDNAESSSSIFHSIENSPDTLFSSPLASNPLSPSTDEEDYFNVPELDVNFEKEDQRIFKSSMKDPKKDDDNLLFDGAPVISPLETTKDILSMPDKNRKKSNDSGKDLFSSDAETSARLKGTGTAKNLFDDEDDDLFTNSKSSSLFSKKDNKEENVDSIFTEKRSSRSANIEAANKSLFGDCENDETDLFNHNPQSAATSKFTKPRTAKNAVEKSTEKFVDPLGLMTDPD